MSHSMIVVKHIRKDHGSTLDIVLDKDLNSLITVLPTELIKRFNAVPSVKGTYRTDMDSSDQDLLTVLKGLRSFKWHTISSHVVIHSNNAEETRFYMEKDLHRIHRPDGEQSGVDDPVADRLPKPIGTSASPDDGKLKRPTLSAEAVHSILGNSTPSANVVPFGFAQRAPGPRRPFPTQAAPGHAQTPAQDPSPSIPAAGTQAGFLRQQSAPSNVGTNLAAQSADPKTPAHAAAGHVPASTLAPPAAQSAVLTLEPAQAPSSGTSSITSGASTAPTPGSTIAGLAQRFMVRTPSNQAMIPPKPVPLTQASTDPKPVEAKNPNSVVNKLLGKYNRKSFVSTGKVILPTASEEEDEEEPVAEAIAPVQLPAAAPTTTSTIPEATTAAPIQQTHAAALFPGARTPLPHPAPTHPLPTYLPATATIPPSRPAPYNPLPAAPSHAPATTANGVDTQPPHGDAHALPPPYETAHTMPAPMASLPSLDTFLPENAQVVEDHHDIPSPMNNRQDSDDHVHFNRRDLMAQGKYASIQRDNMDPHEASKTHHYSRLGAAFVNEGSLNSLMGRGRGGRFGGRSPSGRGFASSL